MSKWHVNPNTGNPGRCRADASNPRGRGCDFQLSDSEHFNSALSAARNYEQQQANLGVDEFSTVSALDATEDTSATEEEHFAPEVVEESFWGRNSTRVGGGIAANVVISTVAELWGDGEKPWFAQQLTEEAPLAPVDPQPVTERLDTLVAEPAAPTISWRTTSDRNDPQRNGNEPTRDPNAPSRNANRPSRKATYEEFTSGLLDGDLSESGFSVSKMDLDAISAGGFFGGKGFQEHVPRVVTEGIQFQGKPLRPSSMEINEAVAKLESLRVATPNTDVYYDRANHFGRSFEPGVVAEIERRDITHAQYDNDSPQARAQGGYFVDPYTGERVYVIRGSNEDTNVEHIVPLHEVAQSQDPSNPLTYAQRIAVANDPDNLQIVGAEINRVKSAKDAGVWLPPNEDSHMRYAIATINVKHRYNLSVDSRELNALAEVLNARSFQHA